MVRVIVRESGLPCLDRRKQNGQGEKDLWRQDGGALVLNFIDSAWQDRPELETIIF
jgi:hypothetical protein